MRRLVIDTASRACSVALFDGEQCIAARHEVIGRGHAERLVPMISELPDHGLADHISVNVGPGSFTGIRVGISAAKALSLAWNVTCDGYNGLALLAAIARHQLGEEIAIDVAINGGHGEYFFQPFGPNGNEIQPAQSLLPVAACAISRASYIAGDAAEALIEMRESGIAVNAMSDASNWSLIATLPPLPPTAAYVRSPDAKLPSA